MYSEDLIKALEHIQQYAASKEVEQELIVPSQTGLETLIKFVEKKYPATLVSGDQLTVSRIHVHGSQRVHANSDTSEQHLDGLLSVSNDWHSKMCFMEVRLIFHLCECVCELILKHPHFRSI